MMKIARLLCTLCACGPLALTPALEARAAESPAHNDASVAAANMGQAAGTTPGRDKGLKAGRPAAQESTQAVSSKGDGSKSRNAAVAASARPGSVTPPHAAGPRARSNADRLHSLHPANARGRIAPTANQRVGPHSAAASGNASARGRALPGASPQALPKSPVPTSAARLPPSVKSTFRGSIIGGPRPVGPGRLGGPPTGRTANNTSIDGTQMHRKF
jgi:hypothetical protein